MMNADSVKPMISRPNEGRIEWVDTAKGIGILFVMLGHCYLDTKYVFWFTSIHMSLFFFLSGYVFRSNSPYLTFLKKKIKSLLVPYCFIAVVTAAVDGFLAVTHGRPFSVAQVLLNYINQKRFTLLWFITCLFISEQVMYWLSRLNDRLQRQFYWLVVGCLFIISFFLYQKYFGAELIWNADLAILAIGIMAVGKTFSDFQLFAKLKKGIVYICLAILWLALAWVNFNYFGITDWYCSEFANPLLFLLAALSGTLFICCISKRIDCRSLTALGRNSLFFFGFHRIIIDLSFALYNKLGLTFEGGTWQAIPFAFVSVALAILVLTPLNRFTLKFFPWCIGKKGRNV